MSRPASPAADQLADRSESLGRRLGAGLIAGYSPLQGDDGALPQDQWAAFIARFTTFSSHIIKGTRPYELPAADIFIFKYSNVAGWVDVAATGAFKALVFDEVQELRNGTATAKGMAARRFCDAAELRVGLSATPIYNYGAEIFEVVEFIAPGALGTVHEFWREWCGYKGKVKDPDALGTYLRDQHIAVRSVRAGLPVNVVTLEVGYDEEVEAEEETLARTLALRVVSGSFVEAGKAARELDILLRRVTGLAKARHVAAQVRMLLDAGTPVLLAGWHRDVYDIWREALGRYRPVFYTGTESPKQKDEAKRAFCAAETDLMIISLRSGAGLDGLQHRCSTLVVGELDWSPKVHEQLIGRLDRPGQRDEVTAIFLHADGGSDPLVVDMLGLKASQSRGIVDPLSGVQEIHSDDSRLKRLAEDYLARKGGGA